MDIFLQAVPAGAGGRLKRGVSVTALAVPPGFLTRHTTSLLLRKAGACYEARAADGEVVAHVSRLRFAPRLRMRAGV
jgi:hypothetical protein